MSVLCFAQSPPQICTKQAADDDIGIADQCHRQLTQITYRGTDQGYLAMAHGVGQHLVAAYSVAAYYGAAYYGAAYCGLA